MEGHRVRRQRSSTTKTKQPEPLERIQPNAAGIDCGSRHHHVAVPVDRDPEPVRRFKTFTPDLYRMVDWLEACRIDTVAMEATGVYWIPIYDILEQRGFKVVLVNARHVKNVPGRKTDVVDCQWIQELHEVGLLRGSFRPSAEIVSLRAYLRHRETLVQEAANHIRRMQKSLALMNVQLHNVITEGWPRDRRPRRRQAGSASSEHEPSSEGARRRRHSPTGADQARNPVLVGYYASLELPYGAGLDTVRRTWKRLVKKYHPDLHSANEQKRRTATELVQGLNRAYEELTRHLERK